MARSEIFHGYRSTTVAFSGVLAVLAAACQSTFVGPASGDLDRYLTLWTSVAAISLAATALHILWREFTAGAGLSRQMTRMAAEQFLPCVAVGGLLTLAIASGARDAAWMLPGLGSLVFSLGIFASCRMLPPQALWVAAYYVVCGVGCLLWGRASMHFHPG